MTEAMTAMTDREYTEEFIRPGNTDMPARGTSGSAVLTSNEWSTISRKMKLSEREFQIVQGVFDDKREVEIARELQISAHTVHTYLGRLYRKLGVSSRAQLIVRVFAEFVVGIDSRHDSVL